MRAVHVDMNARRISEFSTCNMKIFHICFAIAFRLRFIAHLSICSRKAYCYYVLRRKKIDHAIRIQPDLLELQGRTWPATFPLGLHTTWPLHNLASTLGLYTNTQSTFTLTLGLHLWPPHAREHVRALREESGVRSNEQL